MGRFLNLDKFGPMRWQRKTDGHGGQSVGFAMVRGCKHQTWQLKLQSKSSLGAMVAADGPCWKLSGEESTRKKRPEVQQEVCVKRGFLRDQGIPPNAKVHHFGGFWSIQYSTIFQHLLPLLDQFLEGDPLHLLSLSHYEPRQMVMVSWCFPNMLVSGKWTIRSYML